MAVDGSSITEQWIREKLELQHSCLADVRSLSLPGTYEGKIYHVGTSLKNFVRLKSLDLSHNALVTVKGLEHLQMLERLNLYYNRLASLQDVFSLHKLQNLKELDLRLNPVVKKHPHYRLYLVHAMNSLRKLDDCPVRDRERKAALMHFSSEAILDTNHKKHVVIQDPTCRSSDLRIKAMQKMMKMLSLLEGKEEAALNGISRNSPQTTSDKCSHDLLRDKSSESDIIHLINDSDYKHSAKQKQESVIPKTSDCKNEGAVVSHRVTFVSPVVERRRSVRGETVFTAHPTDKRSASQECDHAALKWQNQLQDRANPVLHPPRLTNQIPGASERKRKAQKGAYRKPMELLLGVMENLWSEKEENQQHRTFLIKMVQILSMMEQEVAVGEQEIQTLKDELRASSARIERQEQQHQSEIEDLMLQRQQTQDSVNGLNEQLRNVLEENVSLQKQLIKAERKLLKKIPQMEDRGVQSLPEESDRKTHTIPEVHEGTELQESYRSLIARNERLLQQLEEALMSK